ncbi:MAG: glycine--tRNA ligase [Chitinophagaceae bacterium]|nr:MAG: glycine--tRNA ligase [Chitinophagaceae bacterium]
MKTDSEQFKKIISHAKEYGFVYPSSDIYDGLSAVYDYGPYGSLLKQNIREYWWKSMVQMHENIVGLDAAIFMHPTTWKASGHTDNFNDPMIDNKDSKKRYRVDTLLEEKAEQLIKKGKSEKAEKLLKDLNECLTNEDMSALYELVIESEVVCPVSGSRNWTSVRQFNLMFATQMGSVADDADMVYLRPETAQGIFVNYLNVQKTARMKIPFGIAQTGKAFRNEIVARQFIFRTKEFEQMEMQFFVRPGEEMKWFDYWKEKRMKWHKSLGFPEKLYRFHKHEKLAHYANAAVDIEFEFPFGFREIEGIHSRTDFDLSKHQEFSGKKLQYFDPEVNKNYIPYVVETSIGLDRMFLSIFSHALTHEKLENDTERVVLKIPAALAPVKVALLPLTKKDGLPEKAREIFSKLRFDMICRYDEKDAIGKRYRRQDAIGTPYCITIDHQSLEDNSVTIRERDSMQQERIPIDKVQQIIIEKTSLNNLLSSI